MLPAVRCYSSNDRTNQQAETSMKILAAMHEHLSDLRVMRVEFPRYTCKNR